MWLTELLAESLVSGGDSVLKAGIGTCAPASPVLDKRFFSDKLRYRLRSCSD